ncbi:MAG TPA: hypothetical protein VFT79_02350 [Solirubrobacterales bacterium]|nr:hypothetical protein [Solirubrobacterales bacterium]
MPRGPSLPIACSLLALLAGCGSEDGASPDPQPNRSKLHARDATAPAVPASSHCPSDLPACRVAVGRIVYVERVDPDGDGDAHFVIADPQGITLPGLTAIDVRKGLRPHPLPGPGDLISAAGPVQTGSYGQSQIHALELHVAR